MHLALPDNDWWDWVRRQGLGPDIESYVSTCVSMSWGLCRDPGFDPLKPVWPLLRPEVWKVVQGWSVSFRGQTRVFRQGERHSGPWWFHPVVTLCLVDP